MKLLLYCTKAKPNIVKGLDNKFYISNARKSEGINNYKINGKVVAECDFEVEKIKKLNYDCSIITDTLYTDELINKSCLSYDELEEYLKPNWDKEDNLKQLDVIGYAIHIKNLRIFDETREINDYYETEDMHSIEDHNWYNFGYHYIDTAPKNMRLVSNKDNGNGNKFIMISIKPEELVRVLNGEQKIIIRKKVLKEML